MQQQSGQIEGSFQCSGGGEVFHYLANYAGSRSVDWHATIRCGVSFSWRTGTIAHNLCSGQALEQQVRAQVLSVIGEMRPE